MDDNRISPDFIQGFLETGSHQVLSEREERGGAEPSYLQTNVMRRLVSRMQRTHDRRRASFFVGPPGIGKTTAIEAFRRANPGGVAVVKVMKRGLTGPQALQQLLLGLRSIREAGTGYLTSATSEVQRYVAQEIYKLGNGLARDQDPALFPHITMVFDEAQRLTNGAIDALRDYNEPHFLCRGTFPIGMIFVGNNELSLKAENGGASILDEGMADRLLYRDRLTYDDVERADLELFVRSMGVSDCGAVSAIIATFFGQFSQQRSFRRVGDFIDELKDEAMGEPVTASTVRQVLGLV